MDEQSVNPRSPGEAQRSGGRRAGRARATRRRIVDAATTLFVERGYVATTLEDVATRAGVAVQTVYFHFGNKRTVLGAAVDVASAGDDEPVAVLDRSWMDEVRSEPDPRRAVVLWTSVGREIFERVAPIMAVVREAAVLDHDMAEQWRTNEQQRLVAFQAFVRVLADRDALKPGLSQQDAGDIVFALNSLEVYQLLTTQRGWSPERWERWLADALAAALLP